MGMILMAQRIEGREQFTLNLLDVTIRRNAFGRQVHSFEREIPIKGFSTPFPAVFIRAPIVTECGPEVEALAEVEGKVVAVRQRHLLGTAFHPELTADRRVHEFFLTFLGG
ncbi:MAG: Pyridoxal 5'-phosphate synthase subunit PdxT [Fimbriimonadales bacterium]|nr:Pyridoxal 5'-phosphate synthase subunit PdxT [Fimbriimonadales bacterium]